MWSGSGSYGSYEPGRSLDLHRRSILQAHAILDLQLVFVSLGFVPVELWKHSSGFGYVGFALSGLRLQSVTSGALAFDLRFRMYGN